MLTMPSVAVQNRFGSVARTVISGEPVTVTQHGAPTMVIFPYQMAVEALKVFNAQKMVRFMDAMPRTNHDAPELSLTDINQLVHELRP